MKNINPIPLETGNWRNRLSENNILSRVPVGGSGRGRGGGEKTLASKSLILEGGGRDGTAHSL